MGGKRERRFRVQDLHAYVEGRAVSPSPRAVPLGIPGLTVPDGSHVTHLSLNAQESVDVGASYLLEGIANEESVLLVAPDAAAEHILSAVRGRGGDVAALRKKGRLVLSRGAKKPETMATFISQAAMKARGRFRLFGDMSWAQKAGWSLERLHALENITNASLGRSGKLYLCQYPLWLCSGRVAQLARQADVERGAFYIALSGGSLLEILCPGLVSIPLRDEIYWASWHVFWADERCVPPSSPDSNFAAAERRLFRHVGIP